MLFLQPLSPTPTHQSHDINITSHPIMSYPSPSGLIPSPLHPIGSSAATGHHARTTRAHPISIYGPRSTSTRPPPLHPIRQNRTPRSQPIPMHSPSRVTTSMPPPLHPICYLPTSTSPRCFYLGPMPSSLLHTYGYQSSSHYIAFTVTSSYP